MSIRESIANHLITTLSSMTAPVALKKITREPFDYEQLSNAQFPAAWLQSAEESRGDITLSGMREATINYRIVGFVKSSTIDTARNELIESIEKALEVDRTRGGYALDTQVLEVDTDQGATTPVGGITMVTQVRYQYMRGES
jgi:hypothetical protein